MDQAMAQAPAESGESATKSTSGTISSETYANPISRLPTRAGWSEPLVLYKNYWFRPQFAKNIMLLQDSFKPRPDDIILVTNPKCGTTWLKALAFAITNRSRYAFSNHPLLTRHPQDVVPFLEIPGNRDLTYVETLPSPRLLSTHMPLSLLPQSIASYDCRVVYMCREPKDVFVSRWHHENRIHKTSSIGLDNAFSMFCEGFSPYGPFWDHCLEYWKESIARPNKVLFLKYEEMMLEPVKFVRSLARFLGVSFTDEEERGRVPQEVVRLCSFEMLSGLEVNKIGDMVRRNNLVVENSVFFRKGKVGDWVNHMSKEEGKRLDCIVEEKLKGSGLIF